MDNHLVWKKALAELELEVSKAVFSTMFKQARLVDVANDVATIACTSPVLVHLIETRYYALIKRAIDRQIGSNTSIVFTIDATLKKNATKTDVSLGPLFESESQSATLSKKHRLSPEYTFENFAVSTTNQLAFAAASHVAKNPSDSYNPLFLYGGVGVGKTHLMHAVAQTVLARAPTVRFVLCTGEEFTNEIIEAIRTRTTPQFRNKFRRAELLSIDDVQFIAGREAVQEEFFHTFNAVLRSGGQIVLTSDKPPTDILKLEARLQSRLEGGLLVDIAPPDFELRVAIFLIKAKNRGIDFPVSLAKLIATSITDTRGLEGILTRIVSEKHMKNSELSEELVVKLLGKKLNSNGQSLTAKQFQSPTKDAFISGVCTYFNIKPTQLKGKKRDQSIVLPRQVLMYLLRTELQASLSEIGDLIGGRDHTTVIHAMEKISTLVEKGERVREDILGIKRLVYG